MKKLILLSLFCGLYSAQAFATGPLVKITTVRTCTKRGLEVLQQVYDSGEQRILVIKRNKQISYTSCEISEVVEFDLLGFSCQGNEAAGDIKLLINTATNKAELNGKKLNCVLN